MVTAAHPPPWRGSQPFGDKLTTVTLPIYDHKHAKTAASYYTYISVNKDFKYETMYETNSLSAAKFGSKLVWRWI